MDLMDNVDDIIFCLMVCVGAIASSFLLRNAWGKLGASPAVNMIAYEVIATAEVTVVSSELCFIVYPKYSFYVFLFGEFIYALWTTTRCLPIHQRTTANPVQVMKGYFMAERTFFGSVIIILAQTMGALIAFFAVVIPVWNNASWLIFWKKDTFNLHAMKMKEPSWAASALIEDPITSGLIEGGITAVLPVIPLMLAQLQLQLNPVIISQTSLAIQTWIGCWGAEFSGGYYNPAVASSLELTTVGITNSGKIWIYWICPTVGIILSLMLETVIIGGPENSQ